MIGLVTGPAGSSSATRPSAAKVNPAVLMTSASRNTAGAPASVPITRMVSPGSARVSAYVIDANGVSRVPASGASVPSSSTCSVDMFFPQYLDLGLLWDV